MCNVNKQYQNPPQTKYRPEWSDQNKENLTHKLQEVLDVTEISWEFTDEGLIIKGIPNSEKEIIIGHPRSAIAFLDAYIIGYDHGFSDGNHYRNEEI